MNLSMFSNDQGSWMVCFLCSLIMLLIFSLIYNGFLSLDESEAEHKITGYIGAANYIFMRVAALGTWLGDFMTAWMVTDMMLQVHMQIDLNCVCVCVCVEREVVDSRGEYTTPLDFLFDDIRLKLALHRFFCKGLLICFSLSHVKNLNTQRSHLILPMIYLIL